ncbi:hypothetical protein AK812_SmicGene11842 [Symbiodinium microadriaticum]|uniref:Uncharacterized protein n=1 Tax=Symbiodinium microadriaticum TaxID=2951 RepID=A0A1Q9EC51_SYMMI|nr:hypothetical protein AK812_SmicGene11842 [Symbiodinium microadriaticum]
MVGFVCCAKKLLTAQSPQIPAESGMLRPGQQVQLLPLYTKRYAIQSPDKLPFLLPSAPTHPSLQRCTLPAEGPRRPATRTMRPGSHVLLAEAT